jgi:glutamate N-acetyltransferase/amino-acid N-acetyltransferase
MTTASGSALEDATFELTTETASCPAGFTASGVTCGMRKSGKPDLALFHCPGGAAAAGVFTQNQVRAAPVDLTERALRSTKGRASSVLINSACANAATGPEGWRRAERTRAELASALGVRPEEVLTASTGVIGVQLDADKMIAGYPALIDGASDDGLLRAAQAIMTTDLVRKVADLRVTHEGRSFHVSGVAKGSGMIHPNMATMLGVVMTDAAVEPDALDAMLRPASDRTFNSISVDGDTSTNDCVFAMASGEAGAFPEAIVADAIERVCRSLALQIVRDGEGAKKVVHVRCVGAPTDDAARAVASTVGSSLLVRTAIAGGDPNWGRIVAAVGRSGVEFDLQRLRVLAGGVPLFEDGAPADSSHDDQAAAFAGPDVELEIRLDAGAGTAEYFTCDLTEGYIRINADYTT